MPNDFDTSQYPLGSTHPYVLYNNAGNEDLFVNDMVNETWVDRPPFNRVRKTLFGMEQEFQRALAKMGYETTYLTYVDGSPLQVDRPTQLVARGGSLYAVKLPANFPVTLTGTWATDAPLLVDVGDQSLRTALANGTSSLVDSEIVGFRGRSVADRLDDFVYVTDDHGAPGGGAKGDGVTDDYAAIIAARDFAVLTGRRTLVFPRPTVSYAVGAMLELAVANGFQIIGIGFPTIKYIGASAVLAVVSLDYSVGTGRYGILFQNFNIQGSAQVTEGLYTRAISHSTLRNVRAWDCVHSGVRINSGVCNTYDNVRVTSVGGLAGAPGLAPAEGIVLDQQGVGDYVAWCTFLNPIAENVTANGFRLNSAVGNSFIGGTSEGNLRGIFINTGCHYNRFQNVDFEVNGVNSDMVINGHGNVIDNCQSLSFSTPINYDVQAAQGTIFRGGNLRAVRLQAASRDTKFFGCRFNENGSLGITGPGTYSLYGCVKEDNAGLISVSMPDKVLALTVGGPEVSGILMPVKGVGSTSATHSLRAANAAGDIVIACRDDGVFFSPVSYTRTTGTAANVVVGSDGAFARSTSALKYKNIVGGITDEMLDAFEMLDGMTYTSKIDEDGDRLFVGFVADDFDAVECLRCFVNYGADGEVEGLMYERLTALLHAARKRLSRKLDDMDARLSKLENK